MREGTSDIIGLVDWERKIIAFLAAIVLLALVGPFSTHSQLSLSERFVYWSVVASGLFFFLHVFIVTAMHARALRRLHWLLRIGIGAALAGLPGAAVAIFVHGVFLPPLTSAHALPLIWVEVAAIGWIVGIVEFAKFRIEPEAVPRRLRTAFHRRLPQELGDDIISLSMQDHYAEVTTTLGSTLVLIRLADAIAELDGTDGIQLHRSHFAMVHHIRALHRDGSRWCAEMSDGRSVPVSASHVDAVRSAVGSPDL